MKVTITKTREVRSVFDMRLGEHLRTSREIAGLLQSDAAKVHDKCRDQLQKLIDSKTKPNEANSERT